MQRWLAILFVCSPTALVAQGIDIGKRCNYVLERNSTQIDQILAKPTSSWQPIRTSVIALGASTDNLWLDCSIDIRPSGIQWALVSQYNFARRIRVFARAERISEIEPYPKSLWQRQDAFRLPPTASKILIRYEADLVKTAYFQVMPESGLWAQGRGEASFFFVDAGIVALFVSFNLMLAWSFRSLIPILYGLTTLSYFFYQIIQFGFGPILFYPQWPDFNGNMISISAGVAIVFYQSFFQKLLQFRLIVPRVNRAMQVIHGAAVIYVIVTALGLGSIGTLQKLGRLLFFMATTLVFLGGWIVYRKKFRPALYSIYGFLLMTLCQSLYFCVMAGFIDKGAYYVKALLPIGQLLEYLLFFTTLSLRLRDKGQVNRLRDIARQETVQNELTKNEKLRLSDARAEETEKELRNLFASERIYCDEDLSLDRLADMLHVTRHELSDLLKKKYSTNFYEFVNRHRIEEAQRLLVSRRDLNVLDIALAVGFNTKSTFNKEFKRFTGHTPRETRLKSEVN